MIEPETQHLRPDSLVAPTMGAERYAPLDRAALILMWAYAALLVVFLVAQPLPPLQDYMDWAYQGWVGAHLLRADPAAMAQFRVVHYPVPNAVSQGALTLLTAAVGALAAAKVWMAGLLTAFAIVCFTAVRRLGVAWPGAVTFVLFTTVAANSSFWDGYVNYQISVLLFFCYLLRRERLSPMWIGTLGVLIFFCHAATFFAFAALVFFEAVTNRKRVPGLLALVPSLGLLAWYVLARQVPVADQGAPAPLYTGVLHHLAYKAYTLTKTGPFHNLVDYQDVALRARSPLLYKAGIALNVAFAAALFAALVVPTFRALRRAPKDALLLTAAALFACFLVLPGKLFGVVNLGERLLFPCLLLVLVRLRGLRFAPALAALSVCGAALTAGQFLTMPKATLISPAKPDSTADGSQYYDRYGLYDSRLYEFDTYRVFLEHPDPAHAPVVGFDTSLFVDRARAKHTAR